MGVLVHMVVNLQFTVLLTRTMMMFFWGMFRTLEQLVTRQALLFWFCGLLFQMGEGAERRVCPSPTWRCTNPSLSLGSAAKNSLPVSSPVLVIQTSMSPSVAIYLASVFSLLCWLFMIDKLASVLDPCRDLLLRPQVLGDVKPVRTALALSSVIFLYVSVHPSKIKIRNMKHLEKREREKK